MTHDSVALDRPLPPALHHAPKGLASYRDFPAFSAEWLRRRTLLFALGLGSFGTLIGLSLLVQGGQVLDAVVVGASFAAGGLAIVTTGPLLATIVRHRRLTLRVEQRLVVLMLLVGVVVSFVADSLASDRIEQSLARGSHAQGDARPAQSAAALGVNVLALVVIYGLFGGGLALRSYLDEPRKLRDLSRERELGELRAKNEALDTHLGVLQAQIEPHFLFNSLASVRSLIATDPAVAAEAIDGLVTYLRATIPRLRGAVVESTLDDQIEIAKAYLGLMRARLGRLEVTFEIEPEAGSMRFPPLLLMSLVENAIKHGIEPKSGPGRIDVRARFTDGQLVVRVEDDGLGLRTGTGTGVGLHNVREHLRARYGDRARFTLTSPERGGAVASITIDTAETP